MLEPLLREELGPLTVRFTSRPGEGTPLCQEALAAGAQLVLAIGGDGTASEVAAGFLRSGQAAQDGPSFGLLPCGTGGDFRRSLDLPTRIRQAARAVALARPRPIDAGRLDYTGPDGRPATTYFINIASFGIGGLVDQLVNRSSKWLGGRATFLAASVRASLRYRNARVRLQLDQQPPQELRIYNVAVANGRYFGGGMQVAPEAALDDGLFDVVVLGDLSFPEALRLAGPIYRGTHLGRPKVSTARARQVHAEPLDSGEEVLLDVDGETPGRLPATFSLLPAALRIKH